VRNVQTDSRVAYFASADFVARSSKRFDQIEAIGGQLMHIGIFSIEFFVLCRYSPSPFALRTSHFTLHSPLLAPRSSLTHLPCSSHSHLPHLPHRPRHSTIDICREDFAFFYRIVTIEEKAESCDRTRKPGRARERIGIAYRASPVSGQSGART
jgi:hypothetical protein